MSAAKGRKASARQISVPITAIHEAGHAFGRFTTAQVMGFEKSEAVIRIEMHNPETAPKYLGPDGQRYYTAATTFGPWFSNPMMKVSEGVNVRYGVTADDLARFEQVIASDQYHRDVIAATRAAGIDVRLWMFAKVMHAIAGPVAEAKARDLPFELIIREPQCAADYGDVVRVAILGGLSAAECEKMVAAAVKHFEEQWADPRLWNALLALAARLPKVGNIDGEKCWTIFSRAVDKLNSQHASMTQEAV